jgi:hypothetical protein
MNWKGFGRSHGTFEIPSQSLPGGTEENDVDLSHDIFLADIPAENFMNIN